jgi:hypothetical protein
MDKKVAKKTININKLVAGREKEFEDRVNQVVEGFKLVYLFVDYLLLEEILLLTRIKHRVPWVNASKLIQTWRKETSPGPAVWRGFHRSLYKKLKEIEKKGCASVSFNRLALLIGWVLFYKKLKNGELPEDFFDVSFNLEQLVQTAKDFSPDTLLGDLLVLPPAGNLSDDVRLQAARRLYEKHFPRPIYRRRWDSLRQDIETELERRSKSGLPALDLSILGSIFSLPEETYQKEREHGWDEWRETKFGELPLAELEKNPEKIKVAMANLTTNDLVGPGWRSKKRHMPFEEESKYIEGVESPGELEIAAMNLGKKLTDEWLQKELEEINRLYIEDKLKSLNLTPRERVIIEAKLSGKTLTGTPGSVKVALSKLRKKIQKK